MEDFNPRSASIGFQIACDIVNATINKSKDLDDFTQRFSEITPF